MAKRRNPSKKLVRARKDLMDVLFESTAYSMGDAAKVSAAIEHLAYILIRDSIRDAVEEIER